MRKQFGSTILAAASVVAALCLTAPPAMATGTWTVTGGTNFTAAQASGTTFTLTNTTKHVTFTCTVATASGSVTDQANSTNTAIGSITGATFGSSTIKCTGPNGSRATLTMKSGTTATVNVSSYSLGVTVIVITNYDLVLMISSNFGSCTTEIKGSSGALYTNSVDKLQFTTTGDNLKSISAAGSGCPLFASVGDMWTLSSGSGGLTVTGSPNNPIQMSQP